MFGSHLSIAGGMTNALLEAERLRMDTVQVFTKNQQQWKVRPLEAAAIADWQAEIDRLGWRDRTVSHASYLINLASPQDELWKKSIDLMHVEIQRCETLGIPLLVHHPGSPTGEPADLGMRRIAEAYAELFRRTRGYRTVCCLENTVGAGSTLGRTFDELALLRSMILDQTAEPARVGFCFDTCHAHAGGYDLSTRALAEDALEQFDATCGLAHLRVVHLNDSVAGVGSRKDRHTHVGEGTITKQPERKRQPLRASGFAAVVNRPELAGVPKILETPKGEDARGRPLDAVNLRRLRAMVGPASDGQPRKPT